MRELLRRLRPTCFEDIIAVLALYRPGPMGSGMHEVFADCKNGRRKVEYPHDDLIPILKNTYGVIVFQEQVMQIAQAMSGYSLGEADLLRRAMGKKKAEEMERQQVRFVEGAVERGYDKAKAEEVFELLAKFAQYGFNKSHTAAYALVSYQTAWLKAHHRPYFAASLLSIESSNADKVLQYIQDARDNGVEVLPPDVNESHLKFRVVDGKRVRFGLTAVKGIGDSAVEAILEARAAQGGRFETLDEFFDNIDYKRVNKRVFEALVKCGGFDSMGFRRRPLLETLDALIESAQRRARDRDSGQVSMFGMSTGLKRQPVQVPDLPEWPELKRLEYEKEVLGFYITGHPMTAYQGRWSGSASPPPGGCGARSPSPTSRWPAPSSPAAR